MTSFPEDAMQRLIEYLADHYLVQGLGTEEAACSIAAINLALTGELTDEVPDCMSEVIGHWIIAIQDQMPATLRNSKAWKTLLPEAAGTGREHEHERRQLLMSWMWDIVLPELIPLAQKYGIGDEWRQMLVERTEIAACIAAATVAKKVADIKIAAAAKKTKHIKIADVANAAWAAYDACIHATAGIMKSGIMKSATIFTLSYSTAAACAYAAAAIDATAHPIDVEVFWGRVDPIGMLQKLIVV